MPGIEGLRRALLNDAMSKQMVPNVIVSMWKRIGTELQRERNRIYDEIRSYPPPITACDQQFDRLLEQRERISRELDRMHEVSTASLAHRDPAKLINEFIRSSPYIDDEAEQKIRSSLT